MSDSAPRTIRLYATVLVAATLAAWSNSLGGPFVFDDIRSIVDNPTLRSVATAFSPPGGGLTVTGRPLVNASLALNHAVGGTAVWGYHAVNLLIHALASLTFFGLVRLTLSRVEGRTLSTLNSQLSTAVAFTAALLWALHPLQTESVTYVVQRAESLCGLFFLLTLYGFARGAQCHPLDDTQKFTSDGDQRQCHLMDDTDASRPRAGWLALSAVACLAGMACKEVMVVAPLVVLLYDRTFAAGSLTAALRSRPRYYAALASTWLLLAWLVRAAAGRGGSAGFNTEVSWSDYALTQCAAVARYLRLAFMPRALVFDYGNSVITSAAAIIPAVLLLAGLVAATLIALRRAHALGFLGASFFLILAPSSSILPVATQTLAEHRMYLPLAPLAVLVALGVHAWLGRRALAVACVLAALLGGLTLRRNADYRSELSLWASCAANYPTNPRAHFNHGRALVATGRVPEAIAAFERALALHTSLVKSLALQANVLLREGRLTRAIVGSEAAGWQHWRAAVLHLHLANALALAGRDAEALAHSDEALRLDPAVAQPAIEYAAILRLRANAASVPAVPPPASIPSLSPSR